MASKVPIVKQLAWQSIVPHLVVMTILIGIYGILNAYNFILYGAITYLALSYSLKHFIADDQRKGMALIQQSNFKEAVPYFQKSYSFFKRYAWVDKYRYWTLLSSSTMPYKEMALCNIAFCFGQTGNGKMAIEYYEKALEEFPESSIAKSGLNLIDSISN